MEEQLDVFNEKTETHAEPVHLSHVEKDDSDIRAEYTFDDGADKLKIHLFSKRLDAAETGRRAIATRFFELGDTLKDVVAQGFNGAKVEWIPELVSWYVEVPYYVDGKLACGRLIDALGPDSERSGATA